MQTDNVEWLAVLRGMRTPDEISRATGMPQSELAEACNAWLRRQATLSDRSFSGAVSGLVEIMRDRAGVPHVFAGSTQDLFFGLGVAMAQDRLWQMDRLRRRALGRQAEILGRAYIGSDTAHLTVDIDRIAGTEAEAMDEATHAAVAALAAGINRQIEAFGSDLPIEFRALDSAAAGTAALGVIGLSDANARADAMAAKLRDALNAVLAEEGGNWAVYGTSSGFHLYMNAPGRRIDPQSFDPFSTTAADLRNQPTGLVHKLRLALLVNGVDVGSRINGFLSAAHGEPDVADTVGAFRESLRMLKQEAEMPIRA